MPGTVLHNDGVTPVQNELTPSVLAMSLVTFISPKLGDCCILVLIRSKGCNKIVEHVPLNAPAMNELIIEVGTTDFVCPVLLVSLFSIIVLVFVN